jgi:RluA family pseudouridine synthase
MIKLSSRPTKEFWEIPVLFEDDQLLALDKPSRLLTSPDRYDPSRPNLMRLLHRDIARGAPWARERSLTYLANAHRLDFETSGILLMAKTKPALVSLANQFGSEKTRKTYLALAWGSPAEDSFTVDAPLAPHPYQTALVRVDIKSGKRALTRFDVLERFSKWTLLTCAPATGRTHQIRVHLQSRKHPLVADSSYGGNPLWLSRIKMNYRLKDGTEERPLLGRVALHAWKLEVAHPTDGRPVEITSPWPREFNVALKYLRKFALPVTGAPAA